MADERRRELRRRRILENSDARREKIFGVTKSYNNNGQRDGGGCLGDPTATPAFATSTPLPSNMESTPIQTSQQANPVSHTPLSSRENTASAHLPPSRLTGNESSLGRTHQMSNSGEETQPSEENLIGFRNGSHRTRLGRKAVVTDPRLANTDDFTLGSSFDMVSEAKSIKLTDIGIYPCMLAVLVCFFIFIGLGNVVFNSLLIPFVLFECHQLLWQNWQRRQGADGSNGSGSLLTAALFVCGVSQSIASRYVRVGLAVQALGADFAIYLVTVVLWQLIIGLPTLDLTDDSAEEYIYDANSPEMVNL